MTSLSTLDGGLRVVSEFRPDAETVALGLFLSAGTRDETPAEHGIAHFLEHMAFKGTARRSAFETVAEIEALGGDINAETSHEATSYTVRMLAEDWRTGLDVLLDIATAPRFAAADIALEQDVVVQEIAGALDVPDDRLIDGLGLATFPGQALGQPILGTPDTVNAITADSLRAFRARTYAPGAAIVSVAGPVQHDALVAALAALAPVFPGTAPAARQRPVFAPGAFREARDTHDTHLALAWQAPAYGDEDAVAHALAVQILGGGMTSRLFQSIREEAGLAYAIDAYPMIYADAGLGVIQTATAPDKVAAARDRIDDEIGRLADRIEDAELAAAKRQFRASLAMAGESLSGTAARNARQLAVLGHVRPRAVIEAEIEATSATRVREVWAARTAARRFARAAVGTPRALDLWAD